MAISIVQTKSANVLNPSLAAATTAGNCLIACLGSFNTTTPATVTGVTLGGSADNFASVVSNAAQQQSVFMWHDPACAGGQTAIVISGTHLTVTSSNGGVVIFEAAGLGSSSIVDKTSNASSAGSTWTSGTTATTTQASELWVGAGSAFGTSVPGAPWTSTTAGGAFVAGFQIVSSTGTATYNGSGTATPVSGCVATFKAVTATIVPLPVAQVTVAAPATVPVVAVPLPVAGVTISAPPVFPGQAVALPVARVTISAPAPGLPVILPTAQVTVSARPPAPAVSVALGLAVARVTISARAPVLSRQLLISLASAPGTDDYGNAFPQGIFAGAGIIEGPEFVGTDFIINTSGYFVYNGSPGAGNLALSIAPAAGVDGFGNNYVSGSASYTSSLASALDAGTLTTYSGSLAFGWTAKAIIVTNAPGDLLLEAAPGRQVITANNILDGGAGGATFQADVSVNGANLNIGNGGSANVNLNPKMATPPNTAAVKAGTATLAQTQACLGGLLQSMQNRNMVT